MKKDTKADNIPKTPRDADTQFYRPWLNGISNESVVALIDVLLNSKPVADSIIGRAAIAGKTSKVIMYRWATYCIRDLRVAYVGLPWWYKMLYTN